MKTNKENKQLISENNKICQTLHKAHINTLTSASRAYDKAILSLSTATLGFTFAFVEYVNYQRHLVSVPLLRGTWVLLIASIFFILISFLADQAHSANEISRYQGGSVDDMPCVKCVMSKSPKIAGGCFFIAIIFFTIFVGNNLTFLK